MKSLKHALFLFLLAVLAACSEDSIAPQAEIIPSTGEESVDLISMVVPDIEIADATTRSKFIDDGTELKFVWQENDAIGVVPMSGNPLRFPIHAENAQKNTAVFDGGQWALRTNAKYAAFYPIKVNNQATDVKHIAIDYTGQTQSNWMKYDFLATGAVQPKDGAVKFTMKRLSAILKIKVGVSSGVHVRYCTLTADEAVFGVKGALDLSGTNPVYKPNAMSKSIHTDIGMDKESTDETFTFYLMIPPTDLSGKTLVLHLNSDSGTAKEAEFDGKNFEAGKAYDIDAGESYDPLIRNANLIAAAGLSDVAVGGVVNVFAQRERILKVTSINVSSKNDPSICDEIEYFRKLEVLYCYSNKMTSLDVSNNPSLKILYCYNNQLTSLDVSKNLALTSLRCFSNQLTSLDVSNNPALADLRCDSNQLPSLDVSNNPALANLYCYSNQLSSLDVSNNPALANLYCDNNQLSSLDVSNNPALTYLICFSNQLSSLDVSNNPALEILYCYSNQLTSLDVSNNPTLINLSCYSNQLPSLDVSNNPALTNLRCYSNQLTSLDVSNNPALTFLDCGSNQLPSLDVSNNMALTDLFCDNNQISSFTVTNHSSLKALYIQYNPKLTSLDCSNNILSNLSFTGCTALKSLDCNKNRLKNLSISKFFPTLTRYNVFCGNQRDSNGESQEMKLYHNVQDNTTLRETSLRNWNVTLVVSE